MSSERIKNWPTKERPRERLLAEGPERLTDAELLAIILRVGIEAKIDSNNKLSPESKATALRTRFDEIQTTLNHEQEGSRLWTLANRCIFGTDANDRMARTSKMNMIMHGDGHGGVHHHDGFLNVNPD